MAGSASRIHNFCNSYPNSSGCPWPSYSSVPYVNPCLDPYSIGTTNCKKYTAYVNALPSPTNPDTLATDRTAIVQATPSGGAGTYLGYTATSKINLFSINTAGVLTNKIGFLLYRTTVMYDVPSTTPPVDYTGPAVVTAEVTANWFNGTTLKASAQAQFTYHLTSTASGTGYPQPFSTNTFSTGQQLYGKTLKINSSVFVQSGNYVNQLDFNIL